MRKRKVVRYSIRGLLIAIGITLSVLIGLQWLDAQVVNPGWDYNRAEIIDHLFVALFFILGINIGAEVAWRV